MTPALRNSDDIEWFRRGGAVVNHHGFRIIMVRRWYGIRIEFYLPHSLIRFGAISICEMSTWERAGVVRTSWPHVWWLRWRGRPRLPVAVALR